MADAGNTRNAPMRYLMWIAATAAAIAVMWYFSRIVIYIIVSAVLAIIGKPIVSYITRFSIRGRHIPRWLGATATVLSFWAILVLGFYFFIPVVIDKVQDLASIDIDQAIVAFQQPLDQLQLFLKRYFGFDGNSLSIADTLMQQLDGIFNFKTIESGVTSVIGFVTDTVIAAFSITFITFFMIKEDNLLYSMAAAFSRREQEAQIKHVLDSIATLLRRYFVGLIAESTIIFIIDSIILMILGLGVQTSLFIGMIMGIFNVIPYMGPVIGAAISILTGILYPIAGATAGEMALIVGCTALFGNLVDNFVLQPVLYSKSVKAHPLEIFVVILMAGSIGGVTGMLVAIPAYNVIRVLLKEFFNHSPFVTRLTRNL